MRQPLMAMVLAMGLASSSTAAAADTPPRCRLDDTAKALLAETLTRAIKAYEGIGKKLHIRAVAVNPSSPPDDAETLIAYIVRDASPDKIDAAGCASGPIAKGELLDAMSVRGGCIALAADRPEIRCSSEAVSVFGDMGPRPAVANPALFYLLGHELAHIHQRSIGDYAGRAAAIDLRLDRAEKLRLLQKSCDPASVKREAEADAMSLAALISVLNRPPYREPVLSERGALYWNIDQLALASDAWQKAALEREFISQPKLHPSFVPIEFPTPPKTIERNAARFVCDVLVRRQGTAFHPALSATHPPPEQRLRRIAEALQPVAEKLAATGGQEEFKAVARLQEGLSPIFAHIYRETGVYFAAVQAQICTRVNSSNPAAKCR